MAKAKEIEGLDCAAPARAGIELVLRTRLAEMCAYRTAALDWSDPKGVHDMRVASRRLRSLARDCAPYLRRRLPRKRLRALAAALGAVRDEDVAVAALEELATEAGPELAPGFTPLLTERQRRREEARALLMQALDEAALGAFELNFLRRLERATVPRRADRQTADASATGRTFAFSQAGQEIIAASTNELLAGRQALYRPDNMHGLHSLRIVAKRLRYALELFAPCFGGYLADAADEIAALQHSLGELHDCDVWLADLSARLKEADALAASAPSSPISTLPLERRAAFWLLARFAQARARHYRATLDHWATCESADLFRRLIDVVPAV
jgi:CHAD domain-containing protein